MADGEWVDVATPEGRERIKRPGAIAGHDGGWEDAQTLARILAEVRLEASLRSLDVEGRR